MQKKRNGNIKSLMAGILLGVCVSLTTTTLAVGDSMPATEKLIYFLKNTLMKAFDDAIKDIKETFTLSNSKESGRVASAIGAATDAENKLSVDLYNANIVFQSKSPSNICETNDTAQEIVKADEARNNAIPLLGKPILESNVGSKNVTAQIERVINTHDQNFCGVQDKNCKPGDLSNADLTAWNLLKPEGYTDKELLAAYNYMAIATNPRPRPALPSNIIDSVQGKEARSVIMEEASHLSASQLSYLNYIADRTPSEEGGKAIGLGKASSVDIRKYEVYRRYSNPDWVNEMTEDSYVPAIKEMALMMAYQIKQQHDQDKRFERIELLLATLVSIEARKAADESMKTIRPRASEAVNDK